MILCFCLDDDNGFMFNNRRQSRDKEIVRYFLDRIVPIEGLYIGKYSEKLFLDFEDPNSDVDYEEKKMNIKVCDTLFTENGLSDDAWELHTGFEYIFAENEMIDLKCDFVKNNFYEIIVFRWNRKYPSDVKVDIPDYYLLEDEKYIEGSSHEKITIQHYVLRDY